MKRSVFFALLGVVAAGAQGCGSTVTVASLAPIVQKALPAALVPGAIAAIDVFPAFSLDPGSIHARYTAVGNMSTAQSYIAAFFQNYYSVGLTNNVQGFILAQVSEMDNRTTLYSGQSSSSHSCLGVTPTSLALDHSKLNPTDTTSTNMLKFTMANTQCNATFSGSQGTAGSAEIFGVNGTSTSEAVALTDLAGDSIATGSVFFEAANLSNSGSTSSASPQTVDALTYFYGGTSNSSSTQSNAFWIARFKAIPTTNVFELYYAGNQSSVSAFAGLSSSSGNGVGSYIGPGFRLISDGQYVYADGYLCTDTTGSGCGTTSTVGTTANTVSSTQISGGSWSVFQVCMNASTLAVVDPVATSDCLTLANSWTLSPNASAYTTSTGIFAGGTTSVTQDPFTYPNITGNTNLGNTGGATVPSAAYLSSTEIAAITSTAKLSAVTSIKTY